MSTPVVVEARRLWPEAWITVLANRTTLELLAACPLVDEFALTTVLPFTIRRGLELAKLKRWLVEQRFDLAFILLGDQFAPLLAEAGIPIRVGVRGDLLEPCLTATYDGISAKDWGPSERLSALRTLGYAVREVPPRLWVAEEARASARRRLEERGLAWGEPYAVVHPFGSTPRQWWPAGRVPALTEVLRARHGLRTVVVGGHETMGRPATTGAAVDARGLLQLPELLAVIDGASVAISTDSGPFHIAGALGRPLVGMFRSRRPEHAGRYRQASVAFGCDEACQRRCSWDRCRSNPCRQMAALGPADVLGHVDEVLR